MTGDLAGETQPISTVEVDAATDPAWFDLVTQRRSDVFHSPAWARCLQDAYDFDVRASVVMDPTALPVAGIAYVVVEDLRGARTVALPFSDFCDPVGNPDHIRVLGESLLAHGHRTHVRFLHSPVQPPGPEWEETGHLAWHRIDVTRSVEEIWESLHSSARRAIRKARAAGVKVVPAGGKADLRQFYEMHLRIRKEKYGLLAQPYRFFEAIWDNFLAGDDGVLLLARVDSEVVGGVVYLKWDDTLYYKFNASDRSVLDVRPNDLLVWEGLQLAHEQGLRWLDFGVSDWDQEGLVRYKRKYATEEGSVRRYSAGQDVTDNAGNVLSEITTLLTDPSVPDEVTEKAGESLYRYFC